MKYMILALTILVAPFAAQARSIDAPYIVCCMDPCPGLEFPR